MNCKKNVDKAFDLCWNWTKTSLCCTFPGKPCWKRWQHNTAFAHACTSCTLLYNIKTTTILWLHAKKTYIDCWFLLEGPYRVYMVIENDDSYHHSKAKQPRVLALHPGPIATVWMNNKIYSKIQHNTTQHNIQCDMNVSDVWWWFRPLYNHVPSHKHGTHYSGTPL